MSGKKKPSHLRIVLLALPRRRTKKYVHPVYKPGMVDTGVRPGAISGEPKENWRLDQLSQPISHKKTDKYMFVPEEGSGSGVSPATLAGQGTARSQDLSRPTLRYLVQNKKAFSFLGNPFIKNITKTIHESWNSIYNYYAKSMYDLKKKRKGKKFAKASAKKSVEPKGKAKGKGGKEVKGKPSPASKPKTEKELQEEKEKRIAEWCALRATPKPVHRPPPPPPRKIADLEAMAERMGELAEPTHVTRKYIRPSIDPQYVDPFKVPDSAKTYETSERVVELARCPAHRLVKEPVIKPGAVKRSALTCVVSPRFAELAVPKKKAAEKDNDLNEDAFTISPNAKKYVASARILELSKPVERT